MEDAAVLNIPRSPQELLKEFRETGRQAAFEEIVRRYAGMVFHTCLQVTRSSHDAEDVTQAVFLTLAVQCKTDKPIHALGPWLQQVGHRLSLDLRKSKKRRQVREEKHSVAYGGGTAPESSRQLDVDELKHLLNEELNNLPPKYRMPLILHYFGGLSREEMARELNCKPSTLGVRLFRGREMLGNRLSERGISLSSSVLTAAIAYCIQSSVSDGLVLSTSHAAAALAAGHQPMAGLISAQVLSMSHGAMGAMAMARFKTLAIVVLVTGSTMAAGAQVVSKVVPIDWQLQNLLPQLKLHFTPPPVQSPLPSFSLSSAEDTAQPEPVIPHFGEFRLPQSSPAVAMAQQTERVIETMQARPAVSRAVATSLPTMNPAASIASGATRRIELIAQPGPVIVGEARATATEPARPAIRAAEFALASTPDESDDVVSTSTSSYLPGSSGGSAADSGASSSEISQLLIPSQASARGQALGPAIGFIRIAPPDDGTRSDDASWRHSLSPLPTRLAAASPPSGDSNLFVAAAALGDDRVAILPQADAVYGGVFGMDMAMQATDAVAAYHSTPTGRGPSWSIDSQRLEGWGNVLLGGPLDASGQVIADGRGLQRTLDLSNLEGILNDQDNPVSGLNGWYAMRRGKLTLPALAANPWTTSLTWGEDPSDSTLDLVNSVRLTFDQPIGQTGTVQLSLLSPDRRDVPPLLDSGSILGLWSINAQGVALDDLGLTVRYDALQALVAGSDSSLLRLWGYDGSWRPLDEGFWIDRDASLISARASGISLFAVTANRRTILSAAGPGPAFNGAVPEPSGILIGLGLSVLLLRRRKPRRQ